VNLRATSSVLAQTSAHLFSSTVTISWSTISSLGQLSLNTFSTCL